MQLRAGRHGPFEWRQALLLRKGKLVVGRLEQLRQKIIKIFHSTAASGHSGVHATTKRVTSYCYWKGMEKNIMVFIKGCDTCQNCKYDCAAYPGLIQPLPIPTTIWSEISMDFITGLENMQGEK